MKSGFKESLVPRKCTRHGVGLSLWLALGFMPHALAQQAPVANNDFYGVLKDQSLPISAPGVLANDSDADGDPLTASVVTPPAQGTLGLNSNGSFTYTPPPGFTGTVTFTYKARDTFPADSGVATVTIEVNDPAIGLVGWWKLDESAGTTAADSSGNGNTGSLLNGPVWSQGKKNGGAQFDGANDYFQGTQSTTLEPAGGITVCAWAKILDPRAGSVSDLVRKANPLNGYVLRWSGSNGFMEWWVVRQGQPVNPPTVKVQDTQPNAVYLNAWHFYTGTFDGSTGISKLYVDGILRNTVQGAVGNLDHSGDLWMMWTPPGSHVAIPGDLDDVRIYNRALAPSEVLALAQQPPVAVADSYTSLADQAFNVTAPGVLANDSDLNGEPITAIKVTDPAHGSLTLNADGSFVYTPTAGYSGPDSFTYKANDGTADSNTATVTLNVYKPLKVTGIAPAPGSILGTQPTEILATFSANLDPGTVNANTFKLLGRGPDKIFGTADDVNITANAITIINGNQAKFSLTGVTLANDVYRIVLGGGEPAAGLVGHWKLDESSGLSAVDSSGFGNHGQLQNGPLWQPAGGFKAGALQFDGADDYVKVVLWNNSWVNKRGNCNGEFIAWRAIPA